MRRYLELDPAQPMYPNASYHSRAVTRCSCANYVYAMPATYKRLGLQAGLLLGSPGRARRILEGAEQHAHR